ncbi:MAG: toll/interleukin-1 receptor domain-containing protein [Coriobacteriia bacterium]|nr:toll/interleukin-1 receptor domain-containing protein [Coriobacteriia bacterium]
MKMRKVHIASFNFTRTDDPVLKKLFISHASEDKDAVAKPLAEALICNGLMVWYDEFSLFLGDSLKARIDEGLRECDYAVIVLSKAFFLKHWTMEELDGVAALENVRKQKVLLPIWHEVNQVDISRYSPTLAGKKGIRTDDGLDPVVQSILAALNVTARSRFVRRSDLHEAQLTLYSQDNFLGASSDWPNKIDLRKSPRVKWLDLWNSLRGEFEELDRQEAESETPSRRKAKDKRNNDG